MAKQLRVEIIGDASKLRRALKDADEGTKGFGRSLSKMAKAAALGAGAAGIGALAIGLKSSVDAALEAEKAQNRLESALKSAGISYAKHGDAIQGAIEKTSKLAALDDEDLSDAFSKIVRSTGDVNKALDGMNLAADIARARHISLEQATRTVERAMLGNETALKRVGVEVTKNMSATEALAKAQEQFGGAAAKYGDTAAASQERLSIAFENVQEKIGQKLLPVLLKLSEALLRVIEWTERNWPTFQRVIGVAVDIVKTHIDRLRPIFEGIIKELRGIIELVRAIVNGDWAKIWESLKLIAAGAIQAAVGIMRAEFGILVAIVRTAGQSIQNLFGGAFSALAAIARTSLAAVINVVATAIDKVLGAIQAMAEGASKIPVVGGKFQALADSVGHAREKVRSLDDSIRGLSDKQVTITTTFHNITLIEERRANLPGRQHGGPVAAGQAYMVGETGPEVFVPGQSGTILPNASALVHADQVHIHNGGDVELFAELINRRLALAR